jgi:DNA-binding ferritin-like protein
VSTIQEFIYIFAKFPEIKEDINQGNCKHMIYDAIQSYRNIIKNLLLEHDLFKNSKEEEINEIIDDIENYIERKIYKKLAIGINN